MVRPDSSAAVARMVELRGVQAGFPFYGAIVLEDGVPYSHDLLEDRGALVRPELLAQLGQQVGDRIMIGGQPFTIRGVISKEPGRRVGRVQPRVARDRRLRRSEAAPGCCRSAAAQRADAAARSPMRRRRAVARDLRRELARSVRQRALVPGDRGSDRRGPRARRELSEPRRVRHRRARRHRRVERHARLRAPENAQRRDPEVPGRDDADRCWRPTCCRSCCSALAGSAARRRRSPALAIAVHSGVAGRRARRHLVRADRVRGAAGPRRRHARVAAVLRWCRCSRSAASSRCC